MSEIHRIAITVGGSKYPITTKEHPPYVQELAYELDKSLKQLLEQSKGISHNEGLVLLAMSYLDSYKKEQQAADNLRSQVAEYLEDAAKARLEAGEAKREMNRLERQLEEKKGQKV